MTRRLPTYSPDRIAEALKFAASWHLPGPVLHEDAAAEYLTGGSADDVALGDAKRQIAAHQKGGA